MKKYQTELRKVKSDDDKIDTLDDCDCLCNKKSLSIILIIIISIVFFVIYLESVEEQICSSDKCKQKACNGMKSGLCSGTLCMDLCVYQTLELDGCLTPPDEQPTKNRFFPLNDPPTSAIFCNTLDIDEKVENIQRYYSKPRENISFADFEELIIDLISTKLSYTPKIIDIVEYLFDFADVNRDNAINLPEARTLWSLLDNKHSFYMLIFHDRHYVPRILRFCGDIVEVEELTSTYLFSIKDDSILPSLFPNSYKWSWPKWEYRAKITIGILEFYLEAESFNPNDEYGENSLYLCSPIETSFGYNYAFDVKLLNFEDLLTARELENKLSDRYCMYDADCVYTKACISKCDTNTNRCTPYLAEPQIVNLCRFIKIYLLDEDVVELNKTSVNLRHAFEGLLKRCATMSTITRDVSIFSFAMSKVRKTNSMIKSGNSSINSVIPSSINRHLNLTFSLEYSLLSNELKSLLWSFIRFTKDPPKPKKASTQSTTLSSQQTGNKDGVKK